MSDLLALVDELTKDVPECEWDKLPEDFASQACGCPGDVVALTRYICTDEVDAYRARGWTVTRFAFHHGCNGYWLAVLEMAA